MKLIIKPGQENDTIEVSFKAEDILLYQYLIPSNMEFTVDMPEIKNQFPIIKDLTK